jgi:inorganic pyrophosphatase
MDADRIPSQVEGKPDDIVHVVIETPRDQRHKYAYDPKFQLFTRTQILPEGLTWPYDYGFLPQTLADDGDPIDALFLSDEPTFTGCLVEARVLGIVRICKNGVENDRLITAPRPQDGVAQTTDAFKDIDDLPEETLHGICRYLVEYSEEQGNKLEFRGAKGKKKALHAIEDARKAYIKSRTSRGSASTAQSTP